MDPLKIISGINDNKNDKKNALNTIASPASNWV